MKRETLIPLATVAFILIGLGCLGFGLPLDIVANLLVGWALLYGSYPGRA